MVHVLGRSTDLLGDVMKIANISKHGLIGLLALVGGLYTADLATAKAGCSEGRTSSGQCIKPVMAAAQRKIMVAFTQPKISQSSKLISTVAAPAQIMASAQNINAAQASASTFENLRGPSSYEAQINYSTDVAPNSLSQSQYLSLSEFQSFQATLRNYVSTHNSGLGQFVATYLKDPPVNLLYFLTPQGGVFGPGHPITPNTYSPTIPRSIFIK